MKTVSITITYDTHKEQTITQQIEDVRYKYVAPYLHIKFVQFDNQWMSGKTRITFEGEET